MTNSLCMLKMVKKALWQVSRIIKIDIIEFALINNFFFKVISISNEIPLEMESHPFDGLLRNPLAHFCFDQIQMGDDQVQEVAIVCPRNNFDTGKG